MHEYFLANDDTEGFVNAVESGNVTYLTKFPGAGKKTAQQIILDPKGSLKHFLKKRLKLLFQQTKSSGRSGKKPYLAFGHSAKEITKI